MGNYKSPEDMERIFIRTVTSYFVGQIAGIEKVLGQHFIVLEKAAWVACTARIHEVALKGTLREVEPFLDDDFIWVNANSIVDFWEWKHPLQRTPNN